jgi:glycosyltransferase involved in cell wall biosynthesis
MHKPRVSIGLTVYNGERFLEETLDSFLAQTYSDFELIVADNASTDRTGEIARIYAAKDERVRVHRNEKNLGLAGNHNRVVALARGEYFKWAAADDVCRPNYLARCVEVLDRDPTVVLAYPMTQFIDEGGRPLDIQDAGWNLRSDDACERMRYAIFGSDWANACVGLIRSSALKKTRLMPAYAGGDFRVLGELSLLGKFYEVEETLFVRRLHPGSTSQHGTSGTNPDPKWLIHCWTGTDSKVSLPYWSLDIDHFRTITRSHLSVRQKLSLTRSLLRQMRWQRGKLTKELWAAATAYLPTVPVTRARIQRGELLPTLSPGERNESAART